LADAERDGDFFLRSQSCDSALAISVEAARIDPIQTQGALMTKFMRQTVTKLLVLSLLLPGLAMVSPVNAEPGNRAPELGEYQKLQAPAGNVVAFHAYAEGVQIYRWNGTSWGFVAPEAVLYTGGEGIVGIHYAGPTWESASGSYVVASVLDRATPDVNSIPWLLLKAVDSDGPGIFHRVTYIQRVNTVGGIAPASPGDYVGEEVRVPYSADYYFYRELN
jgi:hypothetical protein